MWQRLLELKSRSSDRQNWPVIQQLVHQLYFTQLTISGIDKQKVSEFAAKVRENRLPEPYKGKGIRYKDEHIRRKEGKKASK